MDLFDAMCREDDDEKRAALTDEYVEALRADVTIERRRRTGAPRMALRPHNMEDWPGLDDIVVERPRMFRAEILDANHLWMACYFDPAVDDRVTFGVSWDKKLKRLVVFEEETPAEWVDIDNDREALEGPADA